MKRIVSVFAFLALFSLCSVLHGEDTVDPDALIARVKEHIAYLDALYEQGIEVEKEERDVNEKTGDIEDHSSVRVAYRGPYELRQLKFLSPYRSSPLDENIDEVLIVRNPAYSFVLVKAKGDSKYTVQDLYNDRDGVLQDQTINGLLTSTSGVLTGLFIGDLRLRDLLDADTFKIELVEKLENQYRLVFQCNVPEDECHRILGGELFFNAEDYSLEERKYNGEFCIPDVVTIPWVRQNKYVYGDWEGIKYPKSIETRFEGNDITSHSMLTIHSFRLGAPNKKEFYLKYYGIPEPKSPRQFPISVFVMIIGVLLIGLGVYLKIRVAKRAAKSAQ